MKITTRLRESGKFFLKSGASIALALFLILSLFTVKGTAPALAVLAQGDAVTDPTAILRNALPIDNKPIRQVQQSIEDIAKHLRAKRWSPIKKDVKDANYALSTKSKAILDSVPEASKSQGEELIEKIKTGVVALDTAVEAKDKEAVWSTRRELLNNITALEELMVVGFPFNVPPEYANLPQLRGRATVEMQTTKGDLTIVVDGYSAPVNGGNFVDLVQRGFYDGLPFIRSEDNFVVQTGDPVGAEEGFIDPKTKQYRSIPLEILIKGEEEPVYGNTLEELGIYLPSLALPFNAFGALALARPDTNPNGGSSQFFFFKFDNELTPPGFNLMDGRYSVFGYLVQGKEVLEELTDKDKIITAKVVYGLNNLVQPS
ncbi:peptidylprolyl isomerase [Microcystis sp. LE19-195.1E]|uniref:peptidylprolyl isomerase n=1 Tax=Microcystis sp. LE19-195.1E TaxID=3016440 RepID=UPI0022C1881C|nr:peptidylprolyl isomerase [Microcystis sp. LE19-195.1E]MCZ8249030.1 peptidylprolyl isomerase [Microcystis sp. LE19-195.1E]